MELIVKYENNLHSMKFNMQINELGNNRTENVPDISV